MDGHAGTNINVALGVEDYGHAEIWNSYHAHEWKAMFFIGCLLQVRKYFLPQGNGLYQPYSNPWDSDVLLSKVWHIMTLFCFFSVANNLVTVGSTWKRAEAEWWSRKNGKFDCGLCWRIVSIKPKRQWFGRQMHCFFNRWVLFSVVNLTVEQIH